MSTRSFDDRGGSLISVVVVMLVLTLVSVAAASAVMGTTRSLVSSRTVLQSRAAADGGIVEMVADATREGLTCGSSYDERIADPSWDGGVTCDTTAKKATFTATGYDGSATTTVRAVYDYWAETSGGAAEGALVSGNGGVNATTVSIFNEGDLILNSGDLNCNNNSYFGGMVGVLNGSAQVTNYCEVVGNLYVDHGNFECNSQGKVGGDVIVMAGDAYVTNNCTIGGRIFVESGNLKCDSNAAMSGDVTVRTGTTNLGNNCVINGNLISRGSVTMTNSVKVSGDVSTLGNFSISGAGSFGSVSAGGSVSIAGGAVVSGAVRAAGTSASKLYGATLGSTWIGGSQSGNLMVTVNGDLVIAGTSSFWVQSAAVTGNLRLGGGYTGSNLTVGGSKLLNQSGLGSPVVTLPSGPTTPTSPSFRWIDFPYNRTKWEAALYTVKTLTSGECKFDNDTTGVAAFVKAQSSPTVIDARACGAINAWGRTFELRTNIVLVVKQINAETVKVRSFDGNDHHFSIVIPDDTDNDAPTCAAGYGTMQLYAFNMDAKIHGMAYSPCTIDVNNSSTTRWNGQIYGGKVQYNIGGIKLYYEPIVLPGLDVSGGGGGSTRLILAAKPSEQGDVG